MSYSAEDQGSGSSRLRFLSVPSTKGISKLLDLLLANFAAYQYRLGESIMPLKQDRSAMVYVKMNGQFRLRVTLHDLG